MSIIYKYIGYGRYYAKLSILTDLSVASQQV